LRIVPIHATDEALLGLLGREIHPAIRADSNPLETTDRLLGDNAKQPQDPIENAHLERWRGGPVTNFNARTKVVHQGRTSH
jgi:hypothetical protein